MDDAPQPGDRFAGAWHELTKAVAMEAAYQAIRRMGNRGRILFNAVYNRDWPDNRRLLIAVLRVSATDGKRSVANGN